jgi:23S rRNA (uracil1939-C5)-methyltransferase
MSCKRTARRPPKLLKLRVDSLAFGGDAVGRDADGRVTFVPDAAPGDQVEVRLVEEHKGFARALLERVIEPSPERVVPPCPIVEECGGCQWQHVAVATQRTAKADIVRRALRKVVAPDDVRPIATPVADLGWRRRARLRFRAPSLGYVARRSHRLVDVASCLQLEPALDAALAAVRARLAPILGSLGGGELAMVTSGRGEVQVLIEAHATAALAAPGAALVGEAGIVGVILRAGGGGPDVTFGATEIDLGDDADAPFYARADGFQQASAAGNATLRALVGEGAGPLAGRRVLELHAGSANFTRDLAAAAAHVTAVEEVAPAAALGARTLAARGLGDRVTWRASTTSAALADAQLARPELLVLDPPRVGLAAGEAAALAALVPERIVYVSCDPETLARDLATIVAGGYRVAWAAPVDLMPQTYHVETVVRLDRLA